MLHLLPDHLLKPKIITWGEEQTRFKQVHERLVNLLEPRLKLIEREWRARGVSSARAKRAALMDSRYFAYVEECLDLQTKAHHCRVQWKTHRMLLDARKSNKVVV